MGVLGVTYSDIQKMDWTEMTWLHEEARRFYVDDRRALIEGLAKAVWGGRD